MQNQLKATPAVCRVGVALKHKEDRGDDEQDESVENVRSELL